MVSGVPSITIPNLSYYGAYGTKMALPVDSSSLVYSHFEHVSGIPATKESQGVSISKLNLLDALINRLNQIDKDGASLAPGLKDNSIDSIIENLVNKVRQTEAENSVSPYLQIPFAQSGILFNLIT